MRASSCAMAAALLAIAACSASGAGEPPSSHSATDEDAGVLDLDAGPLEDAAPPPLDLDAERPLVCGDAGFCETRLPRSDLGVPLSVRGVWAVGPSDVWSVTAEGFVLHYDGTSWKTEYRANHVLDAVWATPTSVWVGGEAGLLFHRSSTGQWSREEPGHVARIRAIYGTNDSDVWFTRDAGSIDHFDGATLTNHPTNIPGLRITSVFGREGFGTYAAGHVPGGAAEAGVVPDRPYVFELSDAGITVLSTSLTETTGFVPVSGFVTNSTMDDRRIFMAGYEHRLVTSGGVVHDQFHFAHCLFGAASPIEIVKPAVPGVLAPASGGGVPTPVAEMRFPGLNYKATDIRLALHMWQVARWDGRGLAFASLAMGHSMPPATIFGAHAGATESWIVGDGFALKGPNP